MGLKLRQKGKRGEREFAAFLVAHGFDGKRGAQHRGGRDSPDVVSEALGWAHLEIKRQERLVLDNALAQAVAEAKPGRVPIVAHRRNRSEWLITLRGEDFLELVAEWEDRKQRDRFSVPLPSRECGA